MLLPESRARRLALTRTLLVAAGCWVVLSVVASLALTETFDLQLLDWRFRWRGERAANDAVAIVGVDDATIRAYRAWPMPRDAYALLLTAIAEGGPRAIGVDFQLPADRNQDPRHDELLAYVSATHDHVVHALSFHADPSDSATAIPAEVLAQVARRDGWGAPSVPALEASEMVLPFSALATGASSLAHVNVSIDRDGNTRRVPFLIRYQERLYPALALRMAAIAWGERSAPEIRPARGGIDLRWPDARRLRLPLDAEGSTTLDFAGDRGAFPNTHSMLEVLHWYRAGDRRRLSDAFGGRLVLVGLTSTREVTDDVGPTPFSPASPLLYLHANAIDSCLRGAFVRRVSPGIEVLVLMLVVFPLALWFATLSLQRALLLMAGAVAAIVVGDQALFAFARLDLPPVVALLAPPVTYAAIATHRNVFLERRSRQREQAIREGWSVQQQFLPEALLGRTLSHYRIDEVLGRGGMGVVYRGVDVGLGRPVAIKVLPGGALADDPSRKRFRRTARALARISHPHIAGLFDFDSQEGLDFLVLELIEGETLAERLKKGPLDEPEMIHLGTQMLDAVGEAHDRGVIHRDLKPANIMVNGKGQVKILDFGIARQILDATSTPLSVASMNETGVPVGTFPYMAPEVIQGVKTDLRTDVYGVGMILYEMGTGRRPFPNDTPHELFYTILNQDPPEPRVLNHRISTGMERIILRSLEKDPQDRYGSAREMRDELLRLVDGRG